MIQQRILNYLMINPWTFNLYGRKKEYKLSNGLMYKLESGEPFLLSYKWNQYFVTYKNVTYSINYNCYVTLAQVTEAQVTEAQVTEAQVTTYKDDLFTFYGGFEDSKEGRLLIKSKETLLTMKEALEVQGLFDFGLVTTFVTDYLEFVTRR